jgi:putative NIF3 family GTP cyclohydrolase 1 type 2
MNKIALDLINNLHLERREFITSALKAAGATALVGLPILTMATNSAGQTTAYTVQDIINIILKEIPGAPFTATVDTLKSGDSNQQVTGIVTTMFPTIQVIHRAVKLKANFIIAHEPTFYNHEDDTNWVPGNEVVKHKQQLLQQHHIAVWRFHDYWHAYQPDGIRTGVLQMSGWQKYDQDNDGILKIPQTSLQNIIQHLRSSLRIPHIRVIGDPAQMCEKVAILPGAAGGQKQISTVEKEKPDLLIVGELNEWETAEYIRDARALGSKTSLIVLGHSQSEEPGMSWLVKWLQPKIPGVQITHIGSEDPFRWS